MIATIAQAMEQCRGREYLFEETFGCRSDEARHLLSCGFMGAHDFTVDGRGAVAPEAALLMLLHRHQSTTTTLVGMGEDFGVDPATLSAFLDVVEEFVDLNWGGLLAVENIANYNHRFGRYRDAVVKKYAQRRHNALITALPGRFVDCSAFLDCYRFRICIPRDPNTPNAQRAFYNRKFGGFSVLFAVFTFPDGMCCTTGGDAGSKNDPLCVSDNGVNAILHAARHANGDEVICMADAAFGLNSNIRPFLRRNMVAYNYYTDDMRWAMAGCRIAAEWSVGEVKMDEMLAEQFLHNKLQQTKPVRSMRISALIRNLFRCMSGCNATTYFDVIPPSLEERLGSAFSALADPEPESRPSRPTRENIGLGC